jgi:hypothetical protein
MCAHSGNFLNNRDNLLERTDKHTDSHPLVLCVSLCKKWETTDGFTPKRQLSRDFKFLINCESSGLGRRIYSDIN